MSSGEKRVVGFAGLGLMGSPMAKNILKNGYPLYVWNRTPTKIEDHVKLGAKVAKSPKELAEKSDVIICMLATPAATEDVVFGRNGLQGNGILDGFSSGKILIDMSTNLPSVVKKIAESVRKKGGEFVDAPVIGSVKPATEGTLTILAAGKKEVVDRVKPILETMGKKIWYVGETGSGCAMKLTMNLHLHIVTGAFAESITFGAKAGLDPALIVEILNNSIFKTYISETKGKKVIDGDWTAAFTLELAAKDTRLAVELAREVGAVVPLGSLVEQLYNTAIANGMKSLDYCALAAMYERLSNVKVSKASSS
ncbi:MAG: NAD(P)-dependent oxidoreductase [Thaumarchaeota archaeon]|jgi:3-hydroxyisobutyrate dehydrogenase-like beta-hydroxyacid dehydrogenase|nr:NAD(P)-dependent oxidoreductase [Nitrososphaerota archaeon]